MEGKTNFSRRLKQFDGLTWLTPTPTFYDRSTPVQSLQCAFTLSDIRSCRVSTLNVSHSDKRLGRKQHNESSKQRGRAGAATACKTFVDKRSLVRSARTKLGRCDAAVNVGAWCWTMWNVKPPCTADTIHSNIHTLSISCFSKRNAQKFSKLQLRQTRTNVDRKRIFRKQHQQTFKSDVSTQLSSSLHFCLLHFLLSSDGKDTFSAVDC